MHYWVTRFKERVRVDMEVKHRETIALDETVIKVNGRQFYLCAALDVERNEIVWIRVYSHRNYLTTLNFVKNVLKYCKNKPLFLVDKGPWYKGVFERLGLEYRHESFGRRSKVEGVFSSYKQRSKAFFNNFNINFRNNLKKENEKLWWETALKQANFFAYTFMLYYNHLR